MRSLGPPVDDNLLSMDAPDEGGSHPVVRLGPADILAIVHKQIVLVGGFIVAAVLSAAIVSLCTESQYRSTVVMHLMSRAGSEVRLEKVLELDARSFHEMKEYARTQLQIFGTSTLLEEVLRGYQARGYDDMPIESGGVGELWRSMEVTPRENTQLIEISVTHPVPERAQVLAELVAEVFLRQNLNVRRDASIGAQGWLQDKLVEYKERVDRSKDAMLSFKETNDLILEDEAVNSPSAKLNELAVTQAKIATETIVAEANLVSHRELIAAEQFAELATLFGDPVLTQMSVDYAKDLSNAARLASRYGPRHPERERAEAQRDQIASLLRHEVNKNLRAEESVVAAMKSEAAALDSEIARVKEQLAHRQRLRARYDDLKEEMEDAKAFYKSLILRDNEVELTAQTQLNDARIVDHAKVPLGSVYPNIPLNIGIAFLVSVVGGIILGIAREYLDDKINYPADVRIYLRLPYLGLIPSVPQDYEGNTALYTHELPQSTVAEATRGVRAVLERQAKDTAPKRLLITSSVSREGKTDSAVRLGIAFASLGLRVALVEADLRRPRLHRVFGIESEAGTTSLAKGTSSLDESVVATEVPNLSIVPCGPRVQRPNELLASQGMARALDVLDDAFDMVILDSPPSAALADAVTLSKLVDGVVMIVRHQQVSRLISRLTVERLQQVGAPILGVVLNRVDLDAIGSRYYAYYYYGYRDYYREGGYTDAEVEAVG